ncbi:unnamed protein product, partial [Adineta steineri]
MASRLCPTRAMLQIPRYMPTLITRTQTTQATPTAGKGIPPPGNFNSAIPPAASSDPSAKKNIPPLGGPAGNQAFLETPAGKLGAVAVVAIGLYAGYKMFGGSKEDAKDDKKKDSKGKDDKSGGA